MATAQIGAPPSGESLDEILVELRRLREEEGRSLKDCSERLGMPFSKVDRLCKRHSIKPPQVVKTRQLSDVLRAFSEDWNRTRPIRLGGSAIAARARGDIEFVKPHEYLVAATGLPATTITGIMRGEPEYTDVCDADALVAAIGLPHAFHDGTIDVVARPA